MGDINKKIDKYDCWLTEIWNGLDKAIAFAKDRTREKNIWVGCKYVWHYQEIVEFMYDLPPLIVPLVKLESTE